MSVLNLFVGTAKAVNYELYRGKFLFALLGVVIVGLLLTAARYFPSSFQSNFQFRVAEHSYAELNPSQKIADLEQHRLDLLQQFKDRMADGQISKLTDEEFTLEVLPPFHIQIRVLAEEQERATQLASELYSNVFYNELVSNEEISIEGSLSAIISEERLMRKSINGFDRQLESINESDLLSKIEKHELKIARLQDSIDETKVELKVIDTKSEILNSQLKQETALQTEISTIRGLLDKRKHYLQKSSEYERRIDDRREQLRYVRGKKDEQARQREQINDAIASDELELKRYQTKLDEVETEFQAQNISPTALESARSKNGSTSLYEQLRQETSLSEIDQQVLLKRKASLELMLIEQKESLEVLKEQQLALHKIKVEKKSQTDQLTLFMKKKSELLDLREAVLKEKNQYILDGELETHSAYIRIRMKDAVAFSPFVAFFVVYLLIFLYVLFDSRIRSAYLLQKKLPYGVKLLEEIPNFNSATALNTFNNGMVFCFCWAAITLSGVSIWNGLGY